MKDNITYNGFSSELLERKLTSREESLKAELKNANEVKKPRIMEFKISNTIITFKERRFQAIFANDV